jgi:hypothetical protein
MTHLDLNLVAPAKNPNKPSITELPLETTKTLQKLTPDNKNGSLPDEDCTVLVESGFL